MIRLLACAALLALPQAASAAKAQACLTRQEAGTFVLFVAPSFLESAAQKCAAVLPPSSFLRTGYKAFSTRLRAEAASDAPALRTVIEKIAGEELPAGVKEETFRTMMEEVMVGEFAKDFKAADCAATEELTSAMSPLPARNVGTIIGTVIALAEDDKKAPFKICKS